MLLACSGGSNVGQIANETAKALDQLGQGRMYCAVGVAAQLPSFVQNAREAAVRVAIDGCTVQCVKKALEAAELRADVEIIVTDLGIKKGHHFNYTQEQIAQVAGEVTRKLRGK